MKKPILFKGEMVRAILEGRKTQTRRVLSLGKHGSYPIYENGKRVSSTALPNWPYEKHPMWSPAKYNVGDLLWVREAWKAPARLDSYSPSNMIALGNDEIRPSMIYYLADGDLLKQSRFRQSMHMPRKFSRITLEVTEVRVQRLQDIVEKDALAEGCRPFFDHDNTEQVKSPNGRSMEMAPLKGPIDNFHSLWDSINSKRDEGKYSWKSNPWVVAYTFKPIFKNVDQVLLELANTEGK